MHTIDMKEILIKKGKECIESGMTLAGNKRKDKELDLMEEVFSKG